MPPLTKYMLKYHSYRDRKKGGKNVKEIHKTLIHYCSVP